MVRIAARASAASRQPADVFQRIVNEVFQLQAAILRYGDTVGSNHGVSASRWQVLAVLARTPFSVAAIARRLGLKRQSVQRTTDLLVDEGLVEMIANPDHSRAKLGRLTPAGARVHAALAERQQQFCLDCARGISLGDLLRFERMLGVLRDRIDHADAQPRIERHVARATRGSKGGSKK
ncbi:MAG: MarR family transcriptional regulator [Steroidobacteraceae bacterium]